MRQITWFHSSAAKRRFTFDQTFTAARLRTPRRCPSCGNRHKPKGRVWSCRKCGFVGHRDIVGAVNMHELGFQTKVTFPALAGCGKSVSSAR